MKYVCTGDILHGGPPNLRPRSKGKINSRHEQSWCTAHMRAEINLLTEKVVLKYCSTHYDHNTKLAHLCLPISKRMKMAGKLYQVSR